MSGQMSRPFTILGAQMRPVAFDPAATLDKFEAEVRRFRAAVPDADLLLFPEAYLAAEDPFAPGARDGYAGEVAEEIPGPLTDRVGGIAASVKRWIAAGSVVERSGDRLYNTALVFDPHGTLVARYRKLFPWAPFEEEAPGDALCAFDVPGVGRLGIMICYDGWFPEVARGLALAGAEVLLHPTLTTTADRGEELILARANAIANQCYVLNVNAATTIGGGRSIGVDPEGRVLFELGGNEEFVIQEVDLDSVTRVRAGGTRGLNRVLHHLRHAPPAVFEPYRRLLDGADRDAD
jgi:formamidase